jgi:hypothetical protein
MAIKYIPKFHEYVGESTDDKSAIATDGAIIYYTDTLTREIFYNGVWSKYIVNINTELEVSDIQIGAVEIKDSGNNNRVSVDSSGNLSVQLNHKYEDIIFHDAVTETGSGLEFNVGGYKELRISISGTAAGFTLSFKGQVGDVISNLMGIESSTLELVSETNLKDTIYEFDIEGYEKVWFGLPEVAGGNITVKGRAVA